MVVFGKRICSRAGGCIRAKMVVFAQRGCNQTKVLLLGKGHFIRAKMVFIRAKVNAFGKIR